MGKSKISVTFDAKASLVPGRSVRFIASTVRFIACSQPPKHPMPLTSCLIEREYPRNKHTATVARSPRRLRLTGTIKCRQFGRPAQHLPRRTSMRITTTSFSRIDVVSAAMCLQFSRTRWLSYSGNNKHRIFPASSSVSVDNFVLTRFPTQIPTIVTYLISFWSTQNYTTVLLFLWEALQGIRSSEDTVALN